MNESDPSLVANWIEGELYSPCLTILERSSVYPDLGVEQFEQWRALAEKMARHLRPLVEEYLAGLVEQPGEEEEEVCH